MCSPRLILFIVCLGCEVCGEVGMVAPLPGEVRTVGLQDVKATVRLVIPIYARKKQWFSSVTLNLVFFGGAWYDHSVQFYKMHVWRSVMEFKGRAIVPAG